MASPHPNPAGISPPTLWTQTLEGAPHGVSLAREKEWLLAWSESGWVCLLDQRGQRRAQGSFPSPLTAGAAAEDGSAFAVADQRGLLRWLAPDLAIRWERTLADKIVAAAFDPHGHYLAAAAVHGGFHVFDRHGRVVSQGDCPRPLHYLAFVPEAALLVGSADYGFVACFDWRGKCLWRDGLVSHVGALAVSGDGDTIALACFTEGVREYNRHGKPRTRIAFPGGCALAALSYDGDALAVVSQHQSLHRLNAQGRESHRARFENKITGLALNAVGDIAIVACHGGSVVAVDFR